MNKRKICFVLIPIILFITLTICIQAGIATRFEGWAYDEAIEKMSPTLTVIMKGITYLGNSICIIIFCLILFIVAKLRKTIALPVSTATISSATLNVWDKRLSNKI